MQFLDTTYLFFDFFFDLFCNFFVTYCKSVVFEMLNFDIIWMLAEYLLNFGKNKEKNTIFVPANSTRFLNIIIRYDRLFRISRQDGGLLHAWLQAELLGDIHFRETA